MGLISDLVKMKSDKDAQAKQGTIDALKLVMMPDSGATPEAREYAQTSLVNLLEGEFGGGGKGKSKAPGGKTGAGGGGGQGGFFHHLLSSIATGLKTANPYGASPGVKNEVQQIRQGMPQKMFLTPEEKEALRAKQAKIESDEQARAAAEKKRQEDQVLREDNQKNYEQEYDRGIKSLGLQPTEAAKRADEIVNKYKPATHSGAGKAVTAVGPDNKPFTAYLRQDSDGVEQLYKLGSDTPLDPTKYAQTTATTGAPKVLYGVIKGQEDQGPQILTFNPRDPSSGFVGVGGQTYSKDEVSGVTNSPPQQQRLYGRPLEISQYVQSRGYKVGTPEYNYYFGIIAGADLSTSLGRTQQQAALDQSLSGIGLGQGFPPIPENPNRSEAAPGGGVHPSPATPPAPTSTAAPRPRTSATPARTSTISPQDDRFISMYLAKLNGDASVSGKAADIGVTKGREALKKITGLGSVDFSLLEAANKDQRKALADTIQRALATQRVNDVLSEFGDETVKRANGALNTGSPLLNKPIRSIERAAVGNPDLQRFLLSLNAFQRQYSNLTAGGALSRAMIPVGVSEHIDKILDPNSTLAEVISQVDQVKIEGQREQAAFKNSARQTMDSISQSLGPGGGAGPLNSGSPSNQTPTRTATGPNGEKIGLINGQWVPLNASTK